MIAEAVELFWALSPSGPLPFPRDLATIAALALPLTLVNIPNLSSAQVGAYLQSIGGDAAILCQDRTLRGCLVAVRGAGAVFLDANDSPDEQRFTLAHEIGHFLTDYYMPRGRALAALGESIIPVLDGDREPTAGERIGALLAHMPLGLHVNLMERNKSGEIRSHDILISEARANDMALELLAPWDVIREKIDGVVNGDPDAYTSKVTAILREFFGLPLRVAADYALTIQSQLRPVTFRDRFSSL